MTARCRHDRGDIGPSNSSAGLLEPLDEGGISMLSGRSVFVVEALDAAIVSVGIGISVSNRPAVEVACDKNVFSKDRIWSMRAIE